MTAQALRKFLLSDEGPTAVEYAVMLALIIVACITIVTSLGKSSSRTFDAVWDAIRFKIG
jgi:pilus assembly protein Flp/PilA